MARQPRCGVLLAGGASTRFDRQPKGLQPLGGARVADYPLRALRTVCDEVVVAANAPDAGEWFPAHRVVRDIVPGVGALSALQTAMVAGHGRTVVVCAWDMPFVNAELLEALVTAVESGSECCVPLHDDGRLEPLCAAYAAECADAATWLLDAGERAAHALADAVGGTRWPVNDLSADRDGQRTFFNVNTPADLTRAADWIDFLPELS